MPRHFPNRPQWLRYIQDGRQDHSLRDSLLKDELPKLRKLAEKTARPLFNIDGFEIFQEGYLGLLDAARTFDPNRGFSFWQYASRRAYGAMQDFLRRQDHLSRTSRRRWKQARDLVAALTQRLGHAPSGDEIRTHLGDHTAEIYATGALQPASLDKPIPNGSYDGRGLLISDLFEALCEPPPSQTKTENFARQAFRHLPMDDACLLWMWAIRGARMAKLADAFGISESSVSQRINHATSLLQQHLTREDAYPLA